MWKFFWEKTDKRIFYQELERTNIERIGVIYEGYRYPHFLDWGYSTPHFSGQKGEEFAVTCCQQKRSAEIKLQ